MPAPSAPAYGREKLLRILALPQDADEASIRVAADQLRSWLARRLAERVEDPSAPGDALARELDDLDTSLAYWTNGPGAPGARASAARTWGAAATLVAVLTTLVVLIAWSAGFRLTRGEQAEPAPIYRAPARLELEGQLDGATLRVLDADRDALLDERPAQGARLELDAGRYALEVRRADCPDVWTRSVFLEPDHVHRFRPTVCAGEGAVVVRSNTTEDRLRIDDLDVGHTGPRTHRLSVGDHTIRVDKPGHRPFEARVRVEPGKTTELRAELAPLGQPVEPVARPLPVAHVVPSAPPVDREAVEAFKKEVLSTSIDLPPIDPGGLDLPKRGAFLSRAGLPALPDGGSTAWHDRVAKQLRDRFDRDGSGEIDRLEESEAISCSVWLEIERDFDRGGLGLSLAHYYGFDGSEWHPGALAVARAHRSAVYAKMRECGLDP
ncbi:MAG: PEGA domain-containing protein [Myxococcota bacterium]